MRRLAAILLMGLLVAAVGATPAAAVPLSGSYSISGVSNFFQWTNTFGVLVALGAADAASFTPGSPASNFTVGLTTGDFIGTSALPGSIKDFRYRNFLAPGSIGGPAISAFETFDGFTFDMTGITEFVTGCDVGCTEVKPDGSFFLHISGTGIFHKAGFDDTSGIFNFSGEQSGDAFAYSITHTTPEPASLLLLGSALVAVGAVARKRR